MVRVTSIIDNIIKAYSKKTKISKEEMQYLYSGMKSTLANKFSILLIARLGREPSDFKPGGKRNSPFMIPEREAPIVQALLYHAVNPNPSEQDQLICDWLTTTGISVTDYERVHDLHSAIETILVDLECDDEIDKVTHEEWMRAIDISIEFEKAIAIEKRVEEMEKMLKWAAILDVPGNGQIIENCEDGSRTFIYNPSQYLYDLEDRPISQIAEECGSMEEFSILLQNVYACIRKVIRMKAIKNIETIAAFKLLPNTQHIENGFHTTDQIASEYYTYYKNIYLILQKYPQECLKIEQKVGITDLLDFLKIDPQLPAHLK